MSNLYWKPEQPPPSTLTRSMVPAGSRRKNLADLPRRPLGDRDVVHAASHCTLPGGLTDS